MRAAYSGMTALLWTLAGAAIAGEVASPPPQPGVFGAPMKIEAEQAAPAAARTGPAASTDSKWMVQLSDRFIRRVIERWSKVAGYQAVYEVDRDVAVVAEASFSGDYPTALGGLMAGLERTELPLRVCLYSNQVARVVRRADRCE